MKNVTLRCPTCRKKLRIFTTIRTKLFVTKAACVVEKHEKRIKKA